jgi:hypothetical protein
MLLVELKFQSAALVGYLPPAVVQFLQADHLRLIGVEQTPVAPRQTVQPGPQFPFGIGSTCRGLASLLGELAELR